MRHPARLTLFLLSLAACTTGTSGYFGPAPSCKTGTRGPQSFFDTLQVETRPQLLEPQPVLEIPATRSATNTARMVARFTVQPDGTVDPCTWEVLESSDDAYAFAAYQAMHRLRYLPGLKDGKPVRTRVRHIFLWPAPPRE
jgi:hypothetical protein